MTWRMRILGLVGVLVALVLAGALALRWALAPARLEAQLEAAVLEATGLPLDLAQPPQLVLLPRLALSTGPGRLGAGPQPLLEWRSLRVDARAASLLGDDPQFGRIVVDGLRLRLLRDAGGRGNWEPVLEGLRARAAQGAAAGDGGLEVAGLELTNARVEYGGLALGALALRTGSWSAGRPLALEGRFTLERAGRRLAVLSAASLRLEDAGKAGWRVADIALRGAARPGALRDDPVQQRSPELPFRLALPLLRLNTPAALATADAATLELGPARLSASALRAEWPQAALPRAAGAFSLAEFAPREMFAALGMAVPRTRDPAVLARGSAKGRFAWDGRQLLVEPLELALDDTRLAGRVGWGDVLEFALQGDALDVDRYREPEEVVSEPFVFPGEAFAAWQARGTLALQRARAEGVELEGVTLRLLLGSRAAGAAR